MSDQQREPAATDPPDPYAHDPLSRPTVPPTDALDRFSQVERRDAIAAAERSVRVRFRRALAATVVLPVTILSAVPIDWIELDAVQLEVLMWLCLGICGVFWWRWSAAIAHRNAWRGEMMRVEAAMGEAADAAMRDAPPTT